MVLATLTAALLGVVPSFHLVLSDGNDQLNGQKNRIAQMVRRHFQEMGIEVTWSFDPSDPSLPATNVVKVMVLPISSADWKLPPGVLAAVRRESESKAVVGVFYPEVERVLGVRQAGSTHTLQGWKPPGRRIVHGVARVVVHEILHYFLPGRPHDLDGVFMDHVGGNLLARSSFAVRSQTRDALVAKLLSPSQANQQPTVGDDHAEVEPLQAVKRDRTDRGYRAGKSKEVGFESSRSEPHHSSIPTFDALKRVWEARFENI